VQTLRVFSGALVDVAAADVERSRLASFGAGISAACGAVIGAMVGAPLTDATIGARCAMSRHHGYVTKKIDPKTLKSSQTGDPISSVTCRR